MNPTNPQPAAPRAGPPSALSVTALFGLLLAFLLALTAGGTTLYRSLNAQADEADARRAALNYLGARVRAADEAGAVRLGTGPEGVALVLAEPLAGSGYATRIYLYEGSLVEDYAPEDAAPDPANAQAIAPATQFTVQAEGPLLRLSTERGTVQVALHCGEVQP